MGDQTNLKMKIMIIRNIRLHPPASRDLHRRPSSHLSKQVTMSPPSLKMMIMMRSLLQDLQLVLVLLTRMRNLRNPLHHPGLVTPMVMTMMMMVSKMTISRNEDASPQKLG